jgi:hypothetical protein
MYRHMNTIGSAFCVCSLAACYLSRAPLRAARLELICRRPLNSTRASCRSFFQDEGLHSICAGGHEIAERIAFVVRDEAGDAVTPDFTRADVRDLGDHFSIWGANTLEYEPDGRILPGARQRQERRGAFAAVAGP